MNRSETGQEIQRLTALLQQANHVNSALREQLRQAWLERDRLKYQIERLKTEVKSA